MKISVAFGSLACEPPCWLKAGILADDMPVIEAALSSRRRRELLWSRGLKAELVPQVPKIITSNDNCESYSLPAISITHDRYFVAVAMSPYGTVGVDLQTECSFETCQRIAETWFPSVEAEEILTLGNCDRFLLSWVIKESWAKCMNRSIFEACGAVGVWQGQAHIPVGSTDIPRFAWARHYLDQNTLRATGLSLGEGNMKTGKGNVGFSIGMCLLGKVPETPAIISLMPGIDSVLHCFDVDWQWISATVNKK